MEVRKLQHSSVEPKEGDPPVHLGNSKRSRGVREVSGGPGGRDTHSLPKGGGLPAAEALEGEGS